MTSMPEFPPRYRDYLSGSEAAKPVPSVTDACFRDSTVVMKTRGDTWYAVWQGKDSILEEFEGTRRDAIMWARQRAARGWVYSEELGDVVPWDADEDTDRG